MLFHSYRRSQNGIVHGIVPKNRHFKVVRHMGTQKLVFLTFPACFLDAVTLSGIFKGKQKLGVTFNFD